MNTLFVASECAPFIKTGGLADVIGALPKAMAPLGHNIRVMLPAYPALAPLVKKGKTVWGIGPLHGGQARLVAVKAEGLDLLLLDAPHLYNRPGNIYLDASGHDWQDNHIRFGALSEIAAKVALGQLTDWPVDLVHIHDWQAGLVSAYMRQSGAKAPPCIITIHNIAFQGVFERPCLDTLGLSHDLFTPEGLEYYGKVSFLKAGIAYSDKITTVSPTYAGEILENEFGMGLDGLLRARKADLIGILNGIDEEAWDPASDPMIAHHYSSRAMAGKAKNRAAVFTHFNLTPSKTAPLFCVVSRLSSQKGLDLLLNSVPEIVGRGGKLVLLGSGDKGLEHGFLAAAHQHPNSVGVTIGYNEPLAHLMQAGADAILIPSRFEPCGLTQLYAMRYGTLPIVARTGGLADTVIDANEAALKAGCATGVQFAPNNGAALDVAIARTCALFSTPDVWKKTVRNAMAQANGWAVSAERYGQLYADLVAS